MRKMRTYNRRIYRNTLRFGVALLAGAVVLFVANVWLFGAVPGWLRTLAGFADAAMLLLGGAYTVTGLYGLAKVRE